MRKTKAGLTIIESDDKLPASYSYASQLGLALNVLREEHNKIAELIDDLQAQIDELKKK